MRLLFHVPSLRGGGAERVWVLMANAMAARGHEVTLLTWNATGPNRLLRNEAVKLVDFGMEIINEGYGKPATLRGLRRYAAYLRAHPQDAVFSGPEFANLITALALVISGSRAKFFPSYHAADAIGADGLGAAIASGLTRLIGMRATRAIAVSDGVARDLVRRGLARRKIEVIHNPLPLMADDTARQYPYEVKLAAMGDGPVIVTAGRLVPVKDHKTLISGFAQLRARMPARLVIFGEGPLEADLMRQARELGIADSVLFAGYVDQPAACYRHADLFALTSKSEGFGNVLVEAMAAGVPVVSTDCPHGPREILEEGQLGSLVSVGDAAGLADAMVRMLDAPTARDLLSARARDFEIGPISERYAALLTR